MGFEFVVAGIVAAGILLYLVYVLLNAENL